MLISYSAAQDPFHAVFRAFCILSYFQDAESEAERFRIYDFLLCFPWTISRVQGKRSIKGFQKTKNDLLKQYVKTDYDNIPDPPTMLKRMEPIQLAALNSMCSFGYLDMQHFKVGIIANTNKEIPERIRTHVDQFIKENNLLLLFLKTMLNQLPLNGGDGLKAKTGLEEYRYDYVPS